MAVDPSHRNLNKVERANQDMYDDFKLSENSFLSIYMKHVSALSVNLLTVYYL